MKLVAAAVLGVASLPMLATAEGYLTYPTIPGNCITLPDEGTFYDGRGRVVGTASTSGFPASASNDFDGHVLWSRIVRGTGRSNFVHAGRQTSLAW